MSSCVCLHVRRAARVLTRMYDEALAPAGLTSMQLGTLDTLSDMGPSTLSELADANSHERSATWRGLQPLIRRELVRRADTAKRPDRYEITPTGAALLDTALELWRVVQGRVVAELGDEAARLTAIADKLERLEAAAKP
ncbi:MAG TPA: MarR family winged helix-turn-helix transcriptional regulator [Phenylobacterium sp.]|nr:MarR family winged helix-turn-helix transcriptional regulator [Phenylobacterium sp.]